MSAETPRRLTGIRARRPHPIGGLKFPDEDLDRELDRRVVTPLH